MSTPSFDGLLTDYALGEIEDPEVMALIEALLDKDEALCAMLTEIRETTELVVLAGPQSLAPRVKPRPLWLRWPVVSAVTASAAAIVLLALTWPGPPAADSDLELTKNSPPAPALSALPSEADVLREAKRRTPWMIAAVDKRSNRTTRRGVGVSWTSLGRGFAESR